MKLNTCMSSAFDDLTPGRVRNLRQCAADLGGQDCRPSYGWSFVVEAYQHSQSSAEVLDRPMEFAGPRKELCEARISEARQKKLQQKLDGFRRFPRV